MSGFFRVIVVTVALIFCSCSAVGEPLPVRTPPRNSFLEGGRRLMDIKGVPQANPSSCLGHGWNRPSRISVGSTVYSVTGGLRTGGFKIFSPTNDLVPVITGDVSLFRDGRTARECAFGEMALSSMLLSDLAQSISVQILDDETNAVYVAHGTWREDRRSCLSYKNLFVRVRGASNQHAFAVALINGGLPASEQIKVSSVLP